MKQELVPSNDEFTIYTCVAKKAVESQFFQKLGGEGALLSIMLYARELGLPPLQAIFGGMNNIQGKIEISPRLMNSMIRKAGHKISIVESGDLVCRLRGTRGDDGESYECEYKMEEAKRAGIFRSGGPWEKYPSDMLFKSCLSRLARRLFPDVISTAYVEDEIEPDETQKKREKTPKVVAVPVADEIIEQKVEVELIRPDQAGIIIELIGEDEELLNRILAGYKVSCLTEIEAKHFDSIIKRLEARKAKVEVIV